MTIYIVVLDGIHWLEYKKHRNKNFKRIIKLEYRKKTNIFNPAQI